MYLRLPFTLALQMYRMRYRLEGVGVAHRSDLQLGCLNNARSKFRLNIYLSVHTHPQDRPQDTLQVWKTYSILYFLV